MAEAPAFYFEVPQCERGVKLKVPAPGGVSLLIPLPENVLPGDEVHMAKGEGGWAITKVLRKEAVALRWRTVEELAQDCASPEALTARLDTTKGPIYVKVLPSWAPLGATRFLELVDDGYYTDIAIYRGIRNGLLQFGVVQSTDPRSGRYQPLPDDELKGIPYIDGIVGFAAAGPGSRKATLCIMMGDFRTQLGTRSTETPFGMVCPESMATLRSITCLGDIPQMGGAGPCPGKLETLGNDYILRDFPTCDFVTRAARA